MPEGNLINVIRETPQPSPTTQPETVTATDPNTTGYNYPQHRSLQRTQKHHQTKDKKPFRSQQQKYRQTKNRDTVFFETVILGRGG